MWEVENVTTENKPDKKRVDFFELNAWLYLMLSSIIWHLIKDFNRCIHLRPSGLTFKQNCERCEISKKIPNGFSVSAIVSFAYRNAASWRSHGFHAGTHRHIYHCAKGQRLMVISHPALASRAMTLICWLGLASLTTKLPLCSPSHKVLSTASLYLHLGSCGLTRQKNVEEEGEELAGVSGSQWPRLKTKKVDLWQPCPLVHHASTSWHTHAMSTRACQHPGNSVYWCWRG